MAQTCSWHMHVSLAVQQALRQPGMEHLQPLKYRAWTNVLLQKRPGSDHLLVALLHAPAMFLPLAYFLLKTTPQLVKSLDLREQAVEREPCSPSSCEQTLVCILPTLGHFPPIGLRWYLYLPWCLAYSVRQIKCFSPKCQAQNMFCPPACWHNHCIGQCCGGHHLCMNLIYSNQSNLAFWNFLGMCLPVLSVHVCGEIHWMVVWESHGWLSCSPQSSTASVWCHC